MKRFDATRNALLTAVAWTGLLLYILACASWSPDGSTLLYSYHNPETDESGVAIYERGSDASRALYVSDENLTPVQWESGGERAILFTDDREILLLPLGGSRPTRRLELPEELDDIVFPVPEVDGNLFFAGTSLTRVNLRSGETTVRERDSYDDLYLFQAANDVLYWRDVGKAFEVGALDLESLELAPRFLVPDSLLEDKGLGDIYIFAFDPRSKRIAVTAGGAEANAILILQENGVESVLIPRCTEPDYRLGSLQWSPDGTLLYASMVSPRDEEESEQAFLAEVAVSDGATRIVPIARLTSRLPQIAALLSPAVSPDGELIAVSTAALDDQDIAPEDRGLYLFDLRDFGSYVSFIPLPESSGEAHLDEGN